MQDTISKAIHGASWLAALLAVVMSVCWVLIVADGNYCWAAFAFMMVASSLAGGIILLGAAPSLYLYLKLNHPRDLISLWLTGGSFLTVVVESILLFDIPQRGE